MASFKYMTDPIAKTQKLGQDLISSIYSRSAIDSIDFVSRKFSFISSLTDLYSDKKIIIGTILASNDNR